MGTPTSPPLLTTTCAWSKTEPRAELMLTLTFHHQVARQPKPTQPKVSGVWKKTTRHQPRSPTLPLPSFQPPLFQPPKARPPPLSLLPPQKFQKSILAAATTVTRPLHSILS